jgi:integrase
MLVFDDERRGLGVRVTTRGSKSYLVQYSLSGAKRRLPLGSCAAISLLSARDAAAAILRDVAEGRDPAADRKARPPQPRFEGAGSRVSLAALIAQWRAERLADKRERYAREAVRALRRAFPKRLNAAAERLPPAAVARVLDQIAADGKPAMASRVAAYGRACYQWAVGRGLVASNPFAFARPRTAAKRQRVLSNRELADLWRACAQPGSFYAIVRMMILTGQRREDVTKMTWAEIAPDLSIWTIPADRTRNGTAHVVPLSLATQMLIGDSPRLKGNPHLFPGRTGAFNGFGKAKVALDKASGVTNWRLPDLRRTIVAGLEKLDVKAELAAAIVGPAPRKQAAPAAVTDGPDLAAEKRAALAAWGAEVEAMVA